MGKKTQDQALLSKTRAGDESNKVLLNQINWIWVANLMNKKAELNPTAAELLDLVFLSNQHRIFPCRSDLCLH